MASEAQILANRRNAEKSTGPRTEEGKAVSSQNAVTHGLTARQNVIGTEEHEEFERHREQMMGELAPLGPVETMLAERAVSLSWRLKRAERMQNEALDCLLAQDTDELGSFLQTGDPGGSDPVLGRAVVKDFANERVLERLMMYERRIETSLFRTMNELHTMKACRRMRREEEEVRRWNMEHGSGIRDQAAGFSRVLSSEFSVLSSTQTSALKTQDSPPRALTPADKTNPISGGVEGWRVGQMVVKPVVSGPPDSACRVAATG